MKRRAFLAALASVPIAGCLEDPDPGGGDETTADAPTEIPTETQTPTETPTETEPPDGDYERCHLTEIRYEWLPDELQDEVDEAVDGGYENEDRPELVEAIDTETAYVVVDEQPYESWADADAPGWILELNEVDEIRLPEPRTITVENHDERAHEVTVSLEGDEGRILDETLSLDSSEEREVEATDAFGEYDLCAETDDRGEECFEFRVSDSYGDGVVAVDGDELFVSQGVAEIEPCAWDRRWD
ncbi:hypothetical protein [Natronorarus salvus]|uniref:hypothetical protein n=1 Tax=Natronorarus salvus TaxID=3117733 RepID=UPI002F26B4D9